MDDKQQKAPESNFRAAGGSLRSSGNSWHGASKL